MDRPVERSLTAKLTIATSGASLCFVLLAFTGPGLALTTLGLIVPAYVAWLVEEREPADSPNLSVSYLAVIVSALVVALGRLLSDFPGHAHAVLPFLFTARYLGTTQMWLLADVIGPVSLMLLGGFWWLTGRAGGRFFPWLVFLYGVGDAMVQFAIEFLTPSYNHYFFLGALAAAAQMAFGLVGLLRLIGRSQSHAGPAAPTNPKTANLWMLLFVAFGIAYGATLWVEAGPLPVGVIVGSMMGGLIGWRRTTATLPADPRRLVPIYLLMLTLFYLHVGEEVLTSFNRAIATITGTPWSDGDFIIVIVLAGPAIWVAGAISLWLRQPFGNFILWFMSVGMILGEPTHVLVFPVIAMLRSGNGYGYFPGMVTALFPMIPAILGLATIVADHRAHAGAGNHAIA